LFILRESGLKYRQQALALILQNPRRDAKITAFLLKPCPGRGIRGLLEINYLLTREQHAEIVGHKSDEIFS